MALTFPLSGRPMISAVSKKLLRELPSEDEMVDILFKLTKAPDHAVAITMAAYLDYALTILIQNQFRELERDDHTRMWDGAAGGLLGGMASKIRLGYALRLYEEPTYGDMLLINHIRNAFAHTLHSIDFANEEIRADCKKLSLLQRRKDMYPDPDKIDAKAVYHNTILDLVVGIQLKLRRVSDI